MSKGDFFHCLHDKLVVIRCNVGRCKNRGKLVLRRRHFIMLRLCQDSKLPQFVVQVFHIGQHARLDRSEIMILQLLALRRLCAVQRAARINQIFSFLADVLVNQEIFLLGAYRCFDGRNVFVSEKLQHAERLPVNSLHGTQKRRFLIERFPAIGTEGGRDTQNPFFNKRVRRRIPRRIPPGFKGSAQTARRKAGGVRFSFYKLLPGKFHNDFSVGSGRNETVMLFRSDACHRLEPMRKMRGALFDGPVLHCVCNHVCNGDIQLFAVLHRLSHCLIRFFGEPLSHHAVIEYHAAEFFAYHAHNNFSFSFYKKKRQRRRRFCVCGAFAVSWHYNKPCFSFCQYLLSKKCGCVFRRAERFE